ncbi:MAG: hypothetical protein R6V37_02595 [Psychroflexus maritimus]
MQQDETLSLFSDNARKYKNPRQLVDEGFLMDSENFKQFVNNNKKPKGKTQES